jgi:phosphoenolpyruvate carboxylase
MIKDFFINIQESIKQEFLNCLLNETQIDKHIKKKFIELQQLKINILKKNNIEKIKILFNEISKDNKFFLSIIDLETKFIDINRRVRKYIINNQSIEKIYSFKKQLNDCFENSISPAEIQKIIDQNLVANFSITAHPTNPFSLEYTILGNQFDEILSNQQEFDLKKLQKILRKIILHKISHHKKTPLQEMIESELAIKNIKIANENLRQKLQIIINNSAYKNKLSIRKNICNVAVWSHGGDADGNVNITAKILKIGLQRIKKQKLNIKIDIRHDAKDIDDLFIQIFKQFTDYDDFNINNLENIIINDKLLKKIHYKILNNKKINDDLIKRLIIINDNIKYIDKFIISNFSNIENFLKILILLKITNKNQKIPKINIVSLSESLDDLKNIAKIHQDLFKLKIYRQHLKNTKKIIAMIAKSDTVRVAGMAVKFYQDKASGQLLFLKKFARDNFGLKIAVNVFSGGGNSLQRGGGKFYEIPLIFAINGLQEFSENNLDFADFDPSYTTIQGQQQQILFSCIKNSVNTIERFALVNLFSHLLAKKIIKNQVFAINKFYKIYQYFSDVAIKNYQEKYYENNFISRLFFNANHLGVALANLSSRPLSRHIKGQNILAPFDFIQFKGDIEKYNLFSTRAITLDRTIAHSGTFLLTFLGNLEGLNAVIKKYGIKKIQEMLKKSFKFHDFLIGQILSIYLVDIDFAWQMMIGKPRPNTQKIISQSKLFFELKNIKKLSILQQQEIVMSFIDNYIFELAKILAKIIFTSDEFLDYQKFNVNILLKKYQPKLAEDLSKRKAQAIFTRYSQCSLIAKYNKNSQTILQNEDLQNIYQLYLANNPSFNTPIQFNFNL